MVLIVVPFGPITILVELYMSADRFKGEYKQIVSTFNDIVRAHVANLSKVVSVVGSHGEGDFPRVLEELPGKERVATNRKGLLRSNVLNLISDASMLSEAAVEGKLAPRADATKPTGSRPPAFRSRKRRARC